MVLVLGLLTGHQLIFSRLLAAVLELELELRGLQALSGITESLEVLPGHWC